MYVSGMDPYFGFFFATSTLIIAIPTAIKVYNWMLTLWRGDIHMTVPMLFALAFLATFVLGHFWRYRYDKFGWTTRSSQLYQEALRVLPGGVNSPVRAMRAVGLDEPVFVRRGEGAYIEDVDGNRFVDWVMSWGPLVFGHSDPETVEVVRETALSAERRAGLHLCPALYCAALQTSGNRSGNIERLALDIAKPGFARLRPTEEPPACQSQHEQNAGQHRFRERTHGISCPFWRADR